jgi:hypothetical protein
VSGANRYQFRFSQPNEGVVAVRTSTNYILQLNWVTGALLAGETYDVEVRVSKNNGATWCTNDAAVWGPVCQVTIGAPVLYWAARTSPVSPTLLNSVCSPTRTVVMC